MNNTVHDTLENLWNDYLANNIDINDKGAKTISFNQFKDAFMDLLKDESVRQDDEDVIVKFIIDKIRELNDYIMFNADDRFREELEEKWAAFKAIIKALGEKYGVIGPD